MFVDDWLIGRSENARLVLHRPQPQEVALQCDQPWETAGPGYPTVTGGALITRPQRFSGCGLEINFSTSAGGSLRAEIQDESGQPLHGFTLADCHLQYGDQLDRVSSWKSGADVSRFAGRPVRLCFQLKDANPYSIGLTTRENLP